MPFVAARAFNGFLQITVGAVPQFRALGPFPIGQVLERVSLWFYSRPAATVTLGMASSGSSDENDAAFRAGGSLIDRSGLLGIGKPVFQTTVAGESSWNQTVHLGRVVENTRQFLLFVLDHGAAASTVTVAISVQVVRWLTNRQARALRP